MASPVNASSSRRSPSGVRRRCATRASVLRLLPLDEPRLLGAADELRHGALRELQPLGELGHRRLLPAVGRALDHQEQEIALRRQPGLARDPLATAEKRRSAGAELGDGDVRPRGRDRGDSLPSDSRRVRERASTRVTTFGSSACSRRRRRSSRGTVVSPRPRSTDSRRARRPARGRSRVAACGPAASPAGIPPSRRSPA